MSVSKRRWAAEEGSYIGNEDDYHLVGGHVGREEAATEVRSMTGWPGDGDEFTVEHSYARWVPAPKWLEVDLLLYLSDRGRGAFPVTIVSPS